jgi:DNA-binding transcriptional ArsR family regulator
MSLNQELQVFLDNVIDSLVKWDLVNYMQQNPSDKATFVELAGLIGKPSEEVHKALQELSEAEVVELENDGSTTYYRFKPSKKWQTNIDEFAQGLMDRNTRWLILNHLVEKTGSNL